MSTLSKSPDVPSTFLTKHSAARLYKVSRVTLDKRIVGGKLSTHTDESGRVFLDPAELERVFGARGKAKADVAPISAEAIEIAEDAAQVAKQEVASLRRDLDKANAENAGLLKAVALVEDMRKDRDSEMSRTLASHKDELARVLADKEELQSELKQERSRGFFGKLFGG